MDPIAIPSQTLLQHVTDMEGQGEQHVLHTKNRRTKRVLNLPRCVPLVVAQTRCLTCLARKSDDPWKKWRATTRDDVRAACTGILIHGSGRKTLYMSRALLLRLVLSFYERLNVRCTSRALAEVYSANCLGLQLDVITTRTTLGVIPRARILSSVLLRALKQILPRAVRLMQREQAMYSGTIVRGDCQWEIAQRIVIRDEGTATFVRPYTALSAWMAVDGSSYQPATPLPKEDIKNLLSDLDPLVDCVKHDRLAGGLPYEQAVFVAHGTDTRRKHRKQLGSFYT